MSSPLRLRLTTASVALAAGLLASGGAGLLAQSTPDQMVASLKQSIAESQQRLRDYQWIETTSISLKGDEKSRKQEQVYYGADGTLTKFPTTAEPPPDPNGGGGRIKKRIVAKKKDEMRDYMERASQLIHEYVPPTPARIQTARDANRLRLQPLGQGHVRVEFPDFVQAGDLFAIDVDTAANRLTAVDVKTYLDKRDDIVTLNVRYGILSDGTSYVAQTTLAATAKKITVLVTNTGHRLLNGR